MRVRLATLSDLSAIVAFGARVHPVTNYAPMPFNAVIARRIAKNAMTSKDSRVWVSEDKHGMIRGVLIGEIGPLFFTHYLAATDLVFIAEQGGDLLRDAFVEWCKLRGVARIDMGVSAGPEREGAVKRSMRMAGFAHSGPMFHRNLIEEAVKGESP